jgi:hypothetical protein
VPEIDCGRYTTLGEATGPGVVCEYPQSCGGGGEPPVMYNPVRVGASETPGVCHWPVEELRRAVKIESLMLGARFLPWARNARSPLG